MRKGIARRVHFYIAGGWQGAAHKSCPALKAKNQTLFRQKQQKSHADVLLSRQKH